MFKKISSPLLAVFLTLVTATPAFATPIVAGLDGRAAITPPSGATSINNILELCETVDGVFNHLAGDAACADVFSSTDTSLTYSEYISLVYGMNLRLSGLSLNYQNGPYSMFSFDGGTLVVGSGYYASDRGCIFTLRDRSDFASPFNQTTDELKIFGGTFAYTGSPSDESAASPICIMTGHKSKQIALDYAKLYLPENYVYINADTGEELTVNDVKLGLVSINKDYPTSVYYLDARRITIAYREPEPEPTDPEPSDPEPTDPEPSDPEPAEPSNPTPSNPEDPETPSDTPPSDEPTTTKTDATPKAPDTSDGSCEAFLETVTPKSLSSTVFFLLVGICLTTYTLMVVIFTTLIKIHHGVKP